MIATGALERGEAGGGPERPGDRGAGGRQARCGQHEVRGADRAVRGAEAPAGRAGGARVAAGRVQGQQADGDERGVTPGQQQGGGPTAAGQDQEADRHLDDAGQADERPQQRPGSGASGRRGRAASIRVAGAGERTFATPAAASSNAAAHVTMAITGASSPAG